MTTNSSFNAIAKKITNAKHIALICHVRPDGDTLGSALALYNHICGKCSVYCDDTLPQKYSFLKGFYDISDTQPQSDLVICLDCSDLNRTGKYAQYVKSHNNVINIDHHISNEKFGHINFVADISSTCEIIYNFLEYIKAKSDKDIYICLYSGLSSDTGNFSHSNTTPSAFAAAAKMCGVIGDISFINQIIFKEMSLGRLKLLTEVLKNITMHIEGKMAILTIKANDVKRFNCNIHDTEGFVDYAVNIEGVEIGATMLETDNNCYKISLRSKRADVCKVAKQFGGGGHIHASGCMVCGQYDEVVDKLIKNAEFYI